MRSKLTAIIVLFVISAAIPQAFAGFKWVDTPGKFIDLELDGKKTIRYMYEFDTSTPGKLHETYKVFYHAFDENGKKLLTKGPDGETKYDQGKYTHHRGIYIGWNKLTCRGATYDLWHMKNNAAQKHIKVLDQKVSPFKASMTTLIHWIDSQERIIIREKRQVIAYRSRDEILKLDFNTQLIAEEDLVLNGDPEHAGFQYRPHNDVASGPADVKAKYLYPSENVKLIKGKLPQKNMPWVALSYGLNGKRYSVNHMVHPSNPKGYVYSAYRDYGRFGAFFVQELKKGASLNLKYRITVKQGDLPKKAEVAKKYLEFVQ